MDYKFYNHKRAVKYCKQKIFLINALYSAAIPLLVVELVGVILLTVPIFILISDINPIVLFAMVAVNSVVIFPGLLILVLYKQTTLSYVVNLAVEYNGPPIVVLETQPNGLRFSEIYELVCLLMEYGYIEDYRIVRDISQKALLVKNGIDLTTDEINVYLGVGTRSRKKSAARPSKKIVYELPDTGADEFCDNCGSPFEAGESFCGFCGTVRKDLRRRI